VVDGEHHCNRLSPSVICRLPLESRVVSECECVNLNLVEEI